MSEADLLQPDHTIKDRWRVVSKILIIFNDFGEPEMVSSEVRKKL